MKCRKIGFVIGLIIVCIDSCFQVPEMCEKVPLTIYQIV